MTTMFQECNELISLDLSNFDTSKVTDMSYMFTKCHKLKKIKGINKFNTINVINMKAMFQECNELISLDLSSFNTSKIDSLKYMFYNCSKLEYLNIIDFKLKNNCIIEDIFSGIYKKCNMITQNEKLNNLYYNFNNSNYLVYKENIYRLQQFILYLLNKKTNLL